MTYDADAATTVLEFEHLRSRQRRRQTKRNTNKAMTPALSRCLVAIGTSMSSAC